MLPGASINRENGDSAKQRRDENKGTRCPLTEQRGTSNEPPSAQTERLVLGQQVPKGPSCHQAQKQHIFRDEIIDVTGCCSLHGSSTGALAGMSHRPGSFAASHLWVAPSAAVCLCQGPPAAVCWWGCWQFARGSAPLRWCGCGWLPLACVVQGMVFERF